MLPADVCCSDTASNASSYNPSPDNLPRDNLPRDKTFDEVDLVDDNCSVHSTLSVTEFFLTQKPEPEALSSEWHNVAIRLKSGAIKSLLSDDELALVKISSCLRPKYVKSLDSKEERFFKTLHEFGPPELQPLLEYHDDGLKPVRKFYLVIKGEKEEYKHQILNTCLTLCALKWP